MKQKHTHRGHCQVCGRIQAAQQYHAMPPAHNLAKHGYTVKDWGFFRGTCQGSDNRPLEEDRSLCDSVLEALEAFATEQDVIVSKLRAGTTTPLKVRTDERVRSVKGWEYLSVPFEQGTKLQQLDAIKRDIVMHEREASHARAHIRDMTKLAAEVHGQPLRPVVHPDVAPIKAGLQFTHTTPRFTRKLTVSGRKRQRWHLCTDQDGRDWTYSAQEIRKHLKAK